MDENCLTIENTITDLDGFCKVLNRLDKTWVYAMHEISQADAEICDLMHEIENSSYDELDSQRLCFDIQDARKRRRRAKNLIRALAPLKKYYDSHRAVEIDLFKVCRDVKNLKTQQDNWVYRPRVLEDASIDIMPEEEPTA